MRVAEKPSCIRKGEQMRTIISENEWLCINHTVSHLCTTQFLSCFERNSTPHVGCLCAWTSTWRSHLSRLSSYKTSKALQYALWIPETTVWSEAHDFLRAVRKLLRDHCGSCPIPAWGKETQDINVLPWCCETLLHVTFYARCDDRIVELRTMDNNGNNMSTRDNR